jgi:hypothetical protein
MSSDANAENARTPRKEKRHSGKGVALNFNGLRRKSNPIRTLR